MSRSLFVAPPRRVALHRARILAGEWGKHYLVQKNCVSLTALPEVMAIYLGSFYSTGTVAGLDLTQKVDGPIQGLPKKYTFWGLPLDAEALEAVFRCWLGDSLRLCFCSSPVPSMSDATPRLWSGIARFFWAPGNQGRPWEALRTMS